MKQWCVGTFVINVDCIYTLTVTPEFILPCTALDTGCIRYKSSYASLILSMIHLIEEDDTKGKYILRMPVSNWPTILALTFQNLYFVYIQLNIFF